MNEIARHLAEIGTEKTVPKNTIVITQGSSLRDVYCVVSGCIKMSRVGRNGAERVVGFKMPGDIFPDNYAFGDAEDAMFDYESLEGTRLVRLSKEQFQSVFAVNQGLRDACFQYLIRGNAGLLIQVAALKHPHATDKLMLMIYHLMVRYGTERKKGMYRINLTVSHAMLAKLVGLSRETVTIELGKLRKHGILAFGTKKLVVNKQALRDKIGEDGLAD